MGKKKHNKIDEDQVDDTILDEEIDKALSEEEEQNEEQTTNEATCEEAGEGAGKEAEEEITLEQQCEALKAEIEKEKKEYLFLMADFENYRRRTLQEKQDLIKNGGQKVLEGILPVVDDIERAIDAIAQGGDIESLKEGVDLIHNKLLAYLKSNNVEPIESTGKLFDTDFHEAVTTFPAPSEDQKGKVIDTVLKGYTLNDKVLRHAKVVVGQ